MDQFNRMLQTLVRERFHLAFHYEQKEIPIYELTVGSGGLTMQRSATGNGGQSGEPWWMPSSGTYSLDKDGYPVFPAGHGGIRSSTGHYRWTAFRVSTQEIARTLTDQLGHPVVDATGLESEYDVDLKWSVDLDFVLSEKAKVEVAAQVGALPDTGAGIPLVGAVQGQLGLKLVSKKGPGDIVVIDHADKVPTEN